MYRALSCPNNHKQHPLPFTIAPEREKTKIMGIRIKDRTKIMGIRIKDRTKIMGIRIKDRTKIRII